MPPQGYAQTSSNVATEFGQAAAMPTLDAAVTHLGAITEAARLLHLHRPGWTALLCDHVPDGGDRCMRCRGAGGFAPTWPCSLYLIGRAAQLLAEPVA